MDTPQTKLTASLLVFDLDGTLMASHRTIFTAMDVTLRKMNIPHTITEEKLLPLIGAHFQEVFDTFGVVVPNLDSYIDEYKKEYYTLLPLSQLYDGITEVLSFAQSAGFTLALLTTKGQEQAEKILEAFNLSSYFVLVSGRKPGRKMKPDPEPLTEICSTLRILPADTIMIGDSEYDVRCGKNAGTKTIACVYGYRTEAFLRNEQPDALVFTPREILKLLQ